jgi:hypothetical protein
MRTMELLGAASLAVQEGASEYTSIASEFAGFSEFTAGMTPGEGDDVHF